MQAYAPLGARAAVLPDRRLRQRLDHMLRTFAEQPNRSIPQATGSRNDMDAAYDFFKNPRVRPAVVVASCLGDTLRWLGGCPRVLAAQDTTDLNFSGLQGTTGLGQTDGPGARGLKLHSSLLVRPDGLPVGLLGQQVWARQPRHKGRAKDRRRRADRDKESFRWADHAAAARAALPADITVVHVADREGDVYEWLAAARPANTHLLVRVAQAQRVVAHGPDDQVGHLGAVVRAAEVLGRHAITVPRADDRPPREAVLTLRAVAVQVQPPRNAKQRGRLLPVAVWALEAHEEAPPPGCQAVLWRLVSTERIATWEDGLRALREYILRWLIERFHFVLKSGCQVEALQLSDADRLANAVAVYSQVAVRVQRLTYLLRVEPEAQAQAEFGAEELAVLGGNRRQRGRGRATGAVRTLAEAVAEVARLGGHLGRKGDGPPGLKVLWRGLQCLHDRVLGYRLAHNTPPSPREDTRNE
jgi:hypothetical protein